MIEFDVDMGYLLEEDELDAVILNDENGEHEPMRFVRERTCVPHGEWERLSQTQEFRRMYCDCGYELGIDSRDSFPFARTTYAEMPRFCPECGARIVSKGKAVER